MHFSRAHRARRVSVKPCFSTENFVGMVATFARKEESSILSEERMVGAAKMRSFGPNRFTITIIIAPAVASW